MEAFYPPRPLLIPALRVQKLRYTGGMIDFPIDELLDEAACLQWLEGHLHPEGLRCPRCGTTERRLFRPEATFPAYRCQECDRYYTVLPAPSSPRRGRR